MGIANEVQITRVVGFSAAHRYSFQGYLPTAVRHRIIDEVNRLRRRPDQTGLDPEPPGRHAGVAGDLGGSR